MAGEIYWCCQLVEPKFTMPNPCTPHTWAMFLLHTCTFNEYRDIVVRLRARYSFQYMHSLRHSCDTIHIQMGDAISSLKCGGKHGPCTGRMKLNHGFGLLYATVHIHRYLLHRPNIFSHLQMTVTKLRMNSLVHL